MAMILALIMAAAAPGYGTIGTGADYLKRCASAALARGEEGRGLRLTCLSFVNGYVRGAAYAESTKPRPTFCVPPAASTEQVMAMIEAWLAAHPADAAKSIEEVIRIALMDGYRCP